MRSAIRSLAGSSRAKNHRLRRFITRHLTLWLVLLILGAVVLSSVLAGARGESRKSSAGAGRKRDTKSVADVLKEKGRVKLEGNGNSGVSGADRERLETELFMNPPVPAQSTTLMATSFAMLGTIPNNDSGQDDPGGTQKENFQSNWQTAQTRDESDKVSRKAKEERLTQADSKPGTTVTKPGSIPVGRPLELQLKRAATRRLDLRTLPETRPVERERLELEPPDHRPVTVEGIEGIPLPPAPAAPGRPAPAAQAPPPSLVFDGLDRENWGAGSPPDTNGDVGPTYYIQSVNTSVGIYRKSDGFREAAFTFDTLMSQGTFGNLCDAHNFGDPVVLYDTFEDRWILTDFAFLTDVSGNVLSPAYQCFAVSMNGNPLTGGWNFYSTQVADFLNDYPKLSVWTDGLYMSANMFSFGAGSTFQGVRVWAFNKAQMYAGSPTVKIVSFNLGAGDFTVLPASARLQTGTPPAGRPNLFLSTWNFLNALSVYKFHVDWNRLSLSTFTGPDVPLAATSWPNANVANAPQPGTATLLDVLQIRAMVQNQYTNFGGTESLWVPHTVRRGNTTGFAAPRWYQVNVTGGTVAPNLPQATTWDPDAANVIHRYMPSLALDRGGNMAMGYTTSNSTTGFPSMGYAGRLSTDPVNTFGQTEQTLFSGTASQTGSTRWGDYSSMTLDPDGCTFWYTNEYANPLDQSFNKRWLTKIASFKFAECTPVGAGGTVSGTVTDSVTTNPISGALVALGSRTTTTNATGAYSFLAIPAGTYPSITASFAGYGSSTATSIVLSDGGTTTQDFSLTAAATSACLVDTTQANFQTGVPTSVDLITSLGDIILGKQSLDQQNTTIGTSGVGITITTWGGQTFTPAVTGLLTKADLNLFCSGCTGTTPNLTLSVRATSGGLPTGADLASATIPGFSNGGVASYFTATFASPPTLTAGTKYAIVIRPVTNPSPGTYALTRSGTSTLGSDVYAGGTRVSGATSGTVWSIPTTGGVNTDAGFRTYIDSGFLTSGNFVSGVKDANPAATLVPRWLTLSWTATTPANTILQFQAAASNSVNGPFNFVGPDGTASTFFTTSGASLCQFNGFRYLKYEALLSTTDQTVTPTLNDVTVCFNNNAAAVPTITPGGPTTFCSGGSVTLTSSSASGNQWYLNGNPIGGATNQAYIATASGNYTVTDTATGCTSAPSSATTVTVNPTPATPTITPGGPTTFCAGGSVTLTSSSASGNQWYLNGNPIGGATNQGYLATASGNYTTIVTAIGCSSAPSTTTTVTVNPLPATPTITPGGPTTFCNGSSVSLTSSSASGNQWYLNGNPIGGATNQGYNATASGNYTNTVTASGCTSSPSTATTVTVNPIPATPTVTPGGPTTFCNGGSVTLTSSSASGNQWYLNGNPIGGATNQQYTATASGNYTDIVTASGCTSTPSTATTVTVNPIPATPTITPGGATTFCASGSVALTSSSAAGNQWYLNGNPIGGATAQQYNAAGSGNYTVTVTASGCTSSSSAATVVTPNTAPTLTYPTPHTVSFGGSLNVTATVASDNGTVTYQVLAGHGLATAPTVNPTGGVSITNAQPAGAHTITVRATDNCGAITDATFTLQVQSPANVSGTKTVSGTFAPGSSITYTVTLSNTSTSSQLDNPGYEFTDVLPSSLVLVSANATSGAATAIIGTNTVSWNGSIAGNGLVTITITATINNLPDATTVSNQGMISYDADGNGTNEAGRLTDDPSIGGASDPTTFKVAGVNSPPDAVNDVLTSVVEDSGMRMIPIASLLSNDTKGPANESGQTLTFSLVGGSGVGGAVSSDATNVYFTPAADFNGVASFQYTVTDNGTTNGAPDPKSDTATVSFTITEVNDAPTAVNDPLTIMAENSGPRTIQFSMLTNNDSKGPANESGQTLTVKTVSNPVGGTVSIVAGTVRFTPAANFNGVATFKYTIEDNGTTNGVPDPKTSAPASVHFIVTEVNDAPTAVGDTLSSVAEDSGQRTIPFSTLTTNDSTGPANESGQALIVKTVSNAVGGTVSILGGNVLFTPTADYNGPVSFDYTVEDNGMTNGVADPRTSGTAAVSFTITEVNDAPTALNDTLSSVAEDSGPRMITFSTLTANDSSGPANESGQTLIVKTVSNAVGGTVSILGGNVLFTPTADYNGTASFQYIVEDNGTTNGVADPKTSGTATASFNITPQADAPSVTNATTNANTQTTSGLVISPNPVDGAEVTHFKITAITGGTLFKNNGTTVINNGDFITFAEGNAGLKFTPGTSNGSFTVQASLSASDAGLQGGTATATITVNPLGGVIKFSAANYSVTEGAGFRVITVERSGDTSQAVTVDYATSDHSNPADFIPCTAAGAGFASSRCDFTTAVGTLRFAAGETSKTFNVLISQDNYVEGPETLTLIMFNPTGGAVFGIPAVAILEITDDAAEGTTNPIDTPSEFVRSQYHDFLGREPDGPGLAFWTDNIEKCNDPARRPAGQTVAQCLDKRRESTAIAFFTSPEFQMIGGFTYRLYKGSLTGLPNYDGGSPGRFPTSLEFMRDVSQVSDGIVVNNQISGAVVEANRNRLAAEFVQRPEFTAKYGGLNNTLYVQELFNTTGMTPSATEQQALVVGLTNGTETRASVLRKVVDGTVVVSESNVQFTTTYGQAFYNQEYRRVFVFTEYAGYLRRNPDTTGFIFWLGKLNQFNGDPLQAEMVRSFFLSPEYRSRFGQP